MFIVDKTLVYPNVIIFMLLLSALCTAATVVQPSIDFE